MTDIQAAMGIHQLRALDSFIAGDAQDRSGSLRCRHPAIWDGNHSAATPPDWDPYLPPLSHPAGPRSACDWIAPSFHGSLARAADRHQRPLHPLFTAIRAATTKTVPTYARSISGGGKDLQRSLASLPGYIHTTLPSNSDCRRRWSKRVRGIVAETVRRRSTFSRSEKLWPSSASSRIGTLQKSDRRRRHCVISAGSRQSRERRPTSSIVHRVCWAGPASSVVTRCRPGKEPPRKKN